MRKAEMIGDTADQVAQAALDRGEISDLINRYTILLDTADDAARGDEEYLRVFTEDVRLTFPIGERLGTAGLADFQREACRAWRRTYHQSGNHVVDLAGDRAQLRSQVWALHIEHGSDPIGVSDDHRLDVGGYYTATAVRMPRGWRIAALEFVVLWTAGGGRPTANYEPELLRG
jgi:hypothetical protein